MPIILRDDNGEPLIQSARQQPIDWLIDGAEEAQGEQMEIAKCPEPSGYDVITTFVGTTPMTPKVSFNGRRGSV